MGLPTSDEHAAGDAGLPYHSDAVAQGGGIPDNELPGMWERADFEGGQDEVRGPDWRRPNDCAVAQGGGMNGGNSDGVRENGNG